MGEPVLDCLMLDDYDHTCRIKNNQQEDDKRIPCTGKCDDYDPLPPEYKKMKTLGERNQKKEHRKEKWL